MDDKFSLAHRDNASWRARWQRLRFQEPTRENELGRHITEHFLCFHFGPAEKQLFNFAPGKISLVTLLGCSKRANKNSYAAIGTRPAIYHTSTISD